MKMNVPFQCFQLLFMFGFSMSLINNHFKTCRGTSQGLGQMGTVDENYDNLIKRYSDCTYVEGNLELINLNYKKNMTFLYKIREVTGYVLIFDVYTDEPLLPNLEIIRGSTTYEYSTIEYSLYIDSNFQPYGIEKHGIKQLGFKSLKEIMQGNVYIFNNKLLCFVDTINWADITFSLTKIFIGNNSDDCAGKTCDISCKSNDSSNEYCWGDGPSMCQTLTKLNCNSGCDYRCFGKDANKCCHNQCAAGCNGTSNADCIGCRNFELEKKCVEFCPAYELYDKKLFQTYLNPDVKYAHGSRCLDKCPDHMNTEKGSCVRECGAGRMNINRTCQECPKQICPKKCNGTSEQGLTSRDINNFANCTIVQGDLFLSANTLIGDSVNSVPPVRIAELQILKSIVEITGILHIELNHTDVSSLDFLSNLTSILGSNEQNSVIILNTQLTSLGLNSLKDVKHGNILVKRNSKLCFAEKIQWWRLTQNRTDQKIDVVNNSKSCESKNQVCSKFCDVQGCWGPGPNQCLNCLKFKLEDTCIESCDSYHNLFQLDATRCGNCDSQCLDGCFDQSAVSCFKCKNVKDGPYCRAICPEFKYPDSNNNCAICHSNCGIYGCTGPEYFKGEGGCNDCSLFYFDPNLNQSICLQADSTICPSHYYREKFNTNTSTNIQHICRPCNSECIECEDGNTNIKTCHGCVNFREVDRCVTQCPDNYYNISQICMPCDEHCLTCYGPQASQCIQCKYYKLYNDVSNKELGFNCTKTCPDNIQFKSIEDVNGVVSTICVPFDENNKLSVEHIVSIVVPIVITIILIGILIGCLIKRNKSNKDEMMRKTIQMIGLEDLEKIEESGIKPNKSELILVKESDLRIGPIIGSGAFGTVYKGILIQGGNKRYVAIKTLNYIYANPVSKEAENEIFNEALIMASVKNPYCLNILALCMGQKITFVTPLLLFGNLLHFVQKNKKMLSPKLLLNWSSQIAKGMKYLHEKNIVHRDLAARNILLQNRYHIRITDFGLSKMLTDGKYISTGGKLPIKWLAIESLIHREFTFMSDVWSYGVTIWEIFTWGESPFKDVETTELSDRLLKGERLPQPDICTIDVFMVIVKCWIMEPSQRPKFTELVEQFINMATDPNRYLVIIDNDGKEIDDDTGDTYENQMMSVKDIHKNNSAFSPKNTLETQLLMQPSSNDNYLEPKRNDHSDDSSSVFGPKSPTYSNNSNGVDRPSLFSPRVLQNPSYFYRPDEIRLSEDSEYYNTPEPLDPSQQLLLNHSSNST